MAEPGEQAPDFTLSSTEGELRLRDAVQGGPVLLAFYTEDATPGCSTEIESLKDACETLRELGASIIAISADSIESHRKFAERLGGLPFPLASDTDLHAAGAYNAIDEDDPRRSRRALFVIGQDGIITYAANPFSPNSLSQLEGALRALGLEL